MSGLLIQRYGAFSLPVVLSSVQYDTSNFPAGAAHFPIWEGQLNSTPYMGTAGAFGLWSQWRSTRFTAPCDSRFGGPNLSSLWQVLLTQINPWGAKNYFGLQSNPTAYGIFQSIWNDEYNLEPLTLNGFQALTAGGSGGFFWYSGSNDAASGINNTGFLPIPSLLIEDITATGQGSFASQGIKNSENSYASIDMPVVLYDAFGQLQFHFRRVGVKSAGSLGQCGYRDASNNPVYDIDHASIYAGAECYISLPEANCWGFLVHPGTANACVRYSNGTHLWQAWNVYSPVNPNGSLQPVPATVIELSDATDNSDFQSMLSTDRACNVPGLGFAFYSSQTQVLYLIRYDFAMYVRIQIIPQNANATAALESEIGFDLNGNLWAQAISGTAGTMPQLYSSYDQNPSPLQINLFGTNGLAYTNSAVMFDCTPSTIRKRLW